MPQHTPAERRKVSKTPKTKGPKAKPKKAKPKTKGKTKVVTPKKPRRRPMSLDRRSFDPRNSRPELLGLPTHRTKGRLA